MNVSESNLNEQKSKKPYAKPEIVYQQPLEAMAAACTGNGSKASSGSPGNCTVLFS